MSRSRKKPIYHVEGTYKHNFWKKVRRVIKNKIRSDKRDYKDIDFLSDLPSIKTICNDWDYNDYIFSLHNCSPKYCFKLKYLSDPNKRYQICKECEKYYSRK